MAARLVLAFLLSVSAFCQAPAAPPQAETTIKDEPATFRSRVNLIQVPVVVRDKSGHATGNLKIDDFVLTDNGKPQFLTKFSVEKPGSREPPPVNPEAVDPSAPKPDKPPPTLPDRFTIYLFDDVHADFVTLARVRDAAINHLDANLEPTDRAAIFTTSGQGMEDFTDNRAILKTALMAL